MISFDDLYEAARKVINPRKLSETAEAGGVGAALLTADGTVYTGTCIDTACSMGFCAEHAAAAAMITAGEQHVVKMIAVDWDGRIMAPCGRCREFIMQLADANSKSEVMISRDKVVILSDLLPYGWQSKKN